MRKDVAFVIFVCVSFVSISESSSNTSNNGDYGNNGTGSSSGHKKGIVIFKFEFEHVKLPFVVCCWVLLASLAKIVFHHYEWLSSSIPESCILILLGIPIGFIIKSAGDHGTIYLTSDLFFYFLLPPIILDAGYFMTSQVFYLNIGTILLYAVFGTIFNTFAVGASMFGVSKVCNLEISLLNSLLFGSLISAVDPVAVLAVFEEVHVNEILYMLVFGESVFNDATSVVLYRTFEALSEDRINAKEIGLAFLSFFVVSIGGTVIGIIFALLTSFITKFTVHVKVIEPIFVFLLAYMAYLSAEMFHFSGIMSILFCGIVMKPYVESNVSRKSHTTIKYFLKLLSSSCESIIFMFLGVSLVQSHHEFNFTFILFTLIFISIYRAIGITFLTAFANSCGRLTKVKRVEQFIMSYGGLRGAVAFCLAILLNGNDSKLKQTLITTTISVVIFTVFVQGCTIKKLVDLLGVKKSQKREKSMAESLNDRVLSYMVAGVEEIIGVHRHGFWRNLLEHFNKKYLRRWLERDPELALDEELVCTQRRIAFKHALQYADKPMVIAEREQDGLELDAVKKNASYAMQFAMKAQESSGNDGGILDINVLNASAGETVIVDTSEAFNPRTIASLIPKAKHSVRRRGSRKYTLQSLDVSDLFSHDSYNMRAARNFAYTRTPERARRPSRHHHHHHQRNNGKVRSRKPSEIPTEEDGSVVKEEHINGRVLDSEDGNTSDGPLSKSGHHSGHHHHHHHHRKHSHSSKNRNRKKSEIEILPKLTETEETVRDVKSSYHLPDKESYVKESTKERGVKPMRERSLHHNAPREPCEMVANTSLEDEPLVLGDYVPDLPAFNESPSKTFSPYSDKPQLDRSKKQLTERDKHNIIEAQRKHSNIGLVRNGGAAPNDIAIDIVDPWSSDPIVEVPTNPWSSDIPPVIVTHSHDDHIIETPHL